MDDKRYRILEAAEALIAENGLQGLAMQQLADRAEVAAGTIYRYFSDKNTMILELHRHVGKKIVNWILQGYSPKASLFEQYQHFWCRSFDYLLENPACIKCKLQFDNSPSTNTEITKAIEDELFSPLIEFYKAGLSEGLFLELPVPVLHALSLSTVWEASRHHQRGEICIDEDIKQQMIAASWRAILKPTANTTKE